MMKMKLNKKIAGATAMLMLSATMLGTSTFAWFTMNKETETGGMYMSTVTSKYEIRVLQNTQAALGKNKATGVA